MTDTKQCLRSFFKLVVLAACVYYLVHTAAKIDPAQFKIAYLWVAFACGFLYFLCTFLMAYAWRWLVLLFHQDAVGFRALAPVYFRSALAKYIPSNVMHYAARHYLCGRFGISHKIVLISNVLEITVIIMAAVVIVGSFLMYDPGLLPEAIAHYRPLLRSLIAVAVGGITAGLVIVIRKKAIAVQPSGAAIIKTVLAVFCFYLLFLLLSGTVLYALFRGMTVDAAMGSGILVRVVFGYVCSWTLGFVTPGAPGGLGVREAAMTAILGPVLGSDIALLGALLFRFSTLLGEVLGYGFALYLERRRPAPSRLSIDKTQ